MGKYGIKIYARVKPTKKTTGDYAVEELEDGGHSISIYIPKSEQAGYVNNKKETYNFVFNQIFDQKAKQDVIFETVARDVIDNCLEGYNGTIFAYGQTGSGKTFTVTGGVEKYDDRGIIPRTLTYLFRRYSESPERMFTTHISYLEIYNDCGYDLLASKSGLAALEDLPKVAMLEGEDGIHLRNLALHPAANEEEALNWLFLGDTNRMIAETPMNMASTRSHCIFTVHFSSREPGCSTIRKAKLHLVDLAGSERVGKTGAKGILLQEAKYINTSLFFLEQVIVALSEKSRSHIPYRNSMMTSVLRDSLGGNCKTTMIATCAVDKKNIDETISTCRFAQRVALVKNEAVLNEELDPKLMVQKLKQKVQELKEELVLATGEERAEELTTEERNKCQELLEAYLQDTSPEAVLQVGGDMRKIKFCFSLLKVEIGKLRSAVPVEVEVRTDEGNAEEASKSGARTESPEERKKSPVVQDQDAILKLELEMIQARLHQRDGEIGILLRTLKQERKRADRAERVLAGAGIPVRTVSPASPDRLSPVRLSRISSSVPPSTASTAASLSLPLSRNDENGDSANSTNRSRVGDGGRESRQTALLQAPASEERSEQWQATLKEELARARQESFDVFKKNHADARTLEYLRKNLVAKYAEAKEFGEKVNKLRLYVNKLKSRIEKYRIARQLHEGTDLSSARENEKEEELKKEMKIERAKFKEQCDILAQMKSEAEHLQHLLQKTKVKIQKDFEVWWSAQKVKGSSPRGVSRRRGLKTIGESSHGEPRKESLASKRESREARGSEEERMLSPRTAWRTPPGAELPMSGQSSRDGGTSSEVSQQDLKSYKCHLRRHQQGIAAQFQLQQNSGSFNGGEQTSPRRRLGNRYETRESNSLTTPGADADAKAIPFNLSYHEKNWNPAVSLPEATRDDPLSEGSRRRLTSPHSLTTPTSRGYAEDPVSPRTASILLTGDESADKDIIAFYRARQKLIDRTAKKQ